MSDEPDRRGGPEYTRYRSRPRLFDRRATPEQRRLRDPSAPPSAPRERPGGRPVTWRRAARWLALAVAGWLALSLALFLVSAQLRRDEVSGAARRALADGGNILTSANTVLVLGSDRRTRATAEPGSSTTGPSRADTIMLMRVGGGHSARLSIPRDTVVDIPGHGQDKVNAAYAFGGAALMVTTLRNYLGIEINHVVEVDFENFPKLVDALGGIDYTGGCVVSRINGGYRNGGVTLRLRAGTHHLDGDRALALARTRKNLCNPRESDLTRARRQQKILAAIKGRFLSFGTFYRLPLVSWRAPEAVRSDMGGPTLLGLAAALGTGGAPETRVLTPSGGVTLPNGGSALVVSPERRRAAVRRFLNG